MKRLIYLKNEQLLDLLVSPLKNDQPLKKEKKKMSSPIYLCQKKILCNRINWASRIEEQRKIIKNNEEKNPNYYLYMYMSMRRCDASL